MLDAFAAACVEIAVISGTAAGLGGRPHAQHNSSVESWNLLHLDSAHLEAILASLFGGHNVQVRGLMVGGLDCYVRF